jgi:antiviral helicase SKI2
MRFKEEKRGIVQLIRLCEKKELLPCVVFVFSKKKISELGKAFVETKGLKLIDNKKENIIINFFDRSLHKLKPEDRKSP